jgi:hypothetical protein
MTDASDKPADDLALIRLGGPKFLERVSDALVGLASAPWGKLF